MCLFCGPINKEIRRLEAFRDRNCADNKPRESYHKRYYDENRDKISVKRKRYYAENKERILAQRARKRELQKEGALRDSTSGDVLRKD